MSDFPRANKPNPGSDVSPSPSSDASSPVLAPTTAEPERAAIPDGPPDGGLSAWLQVLGSFFLFMNSWGIVNSFGVYQSYYASDLLSTESASDISWVGSIQAFLLLIVGIATGPLFDLGHFHMLLRAGSFLVVFGLMMTSLCTSYWQVMLAQGIVVGLGSGCLFVPSVAIVSTYFTTKKAFATGLAAAGSSIGGVIYPIVFAQLQPSIGFAWATRVIGFVALAGCVFAAAVMQPRVLPKSVRRLLEPRAFLDVPYTLFTTGLFLGFMGMYIPFFYVQSYGEAHGLGTSLSFYLLAITNATSTLGRIMPNLLADKMGPLSVLTPCCAVSAVLAFCWIAAKDKAGIVVFCILYGFFSGSFVSLPAPTVVTLSPSMAVLGARMGMSFSFAGLGILVGNPVAGAILDSYGWVGLQAFGGACVVAATICCALARFVKAPSLSEKA